MTLTLNKKNYLQLLDKIEIIPKIIETETEYEQYLIVTEKLMQKKDNRTSEETALFRLLVKLIEDYEENVYKLEEWINLKPHEILQHLLDSNQKKFNDLLGVISDSKDEIESIISGKISINQQQAQILGNYFNLSPNLFL